MTYKVDSPEAEEFIHHEEILETLEYARTNKDNRALIEQLIEKAALCKEMCIRDRIRRRRITVHVFLYQNHCFRSQRHRQGTACFTPTIRDHVITQITLA